VESQAAQTSEHLALNVLNSVLLVTGPRVNLGPVFYCPHNRLEGTASIMSSIPNLTIVIFYWAALTYFYG